MKSNYKLL